MKTILIIGAGLSASSLIRYLLQNSVEQNWIVSVCDQDIKLVETKLNGHPNGRALQFNALDATERRPFLESADLIISMLPARFHIDIAKDCIELGKNLITPSYVSKQMKELDQAAKEAGIIIMNEIGVDPGIDHMSAMRVIDEIHSKGGKLEAFRSFCGGLIAPESDNNPWNYKFTWNPRNVVLAGAGGAASFIRHGRYKYIPYHRLFDRLDHMTIEGFGDFTGYPNRDSLSYRSIYGLENIPTMYRGTLRRPDFCEAWSVFVELGLTDDSYEMSEIANATPRQFVNAFLPFHPDKTVEQKFKEFLRPEREQLFSKFEWLGLFDDSRHLNIVNPTPARLLECILVEKWQLEKGDKDMLVMLHEFEFEIDGVSKKITSSMVNIGEDQTYTSMSNTVGLPVAICSKLILNGKIPYTGVQLPILPEIYNPILDELETFGIKFKETEQNL